MSLLAFRPGKVGGAETYVRKLLALLPGALEAGDALVAVMDADLAGALETPGWARIVLPCGGSRIVAARVAEALTPFRARAAEEAFRSADADVLLFPQQSIFPKRVGGRCVVTVGDVQHLVHPEHIPVAERVFRWGIYPYSLRRADRLVAVSACTRRTLVDRCGVAAEKIAVVPHGFDPASGASVRPTDRVAGPYLYYPAATFPHKNHAELIRSYAVLRRAGQLDAKLVFTGMQTAAWPALARIAGESGVGGEVVHLGFLPYEEVRRVYAGAEAVVFPTRFEGFGLPVLEAYAFGKRVITSRLEVFDELGVPREAQVDFADPGQLLAALARPGLTRPLRPPAPWADVAARTMGVLRAACALPGAPEGGRR